MAGISIQLDGSPIATINLSGMDVVEVSAHGALDQNPKAVLSASGGNYAHGGRGHLIWVAEKSLLRGEVLSVTLHDACDSSEEGKTIQELFPDEEPCTRTDFTINDEIAAQLRARPVLHNDFAVQVETSQGQRAVAVSNQHNTSFSFRVLWDFTRPAQARVRLATHCLEDVLARRPGTDHLTAILSFGDSAEFALTR